MFFAARETRTRTPATLDALLGDLPDAWTAATEGPATWSPFVVIGHLIHAEKAGLDSASGDHSGVLATSRPFVLLTASAQLRAA